MDILRKSKSRISWPTNKLRRVPFLDCLSDVELSAFEQVIEKKFFRKKDLILKEENTPNFMYLVYSGKVKVVQSNANGKERILAFHKPGDFFGEMALLDGKTVPASVVAVENTEIGLLTKNEFDQYLLKNNKVVQQIIILLCSRLRESWCMLRVMSFADAEQRVREVIAQMGRLYGVKDERGTIVTQKLTHKDIADCASVARETATRLLKRFTREDELEVLENKFLLLKPSFYKKFELL